MTRLRRTPAAVLALVLLFVLLACCTSTRAATRVTSHSRRLHESPQVAAAGAAAAGVQAAAKAVAALKLAPGGAPVTFDDATTLLQPVDAVADPKAAAVAQVVDALNVGGAKADTKETEKKFAPAVRAPKGGVRLIKDILTGKLKPLPPRNNATTTADAADAAADAADTKAADKKAGARPRRGGRKGDAERMSAVVAAAVAGKKDSVAINTPKRGPAGSRGAAAAQGQGQRPDARSQAARRHEAKINGARGGTRRGARKGGRNDKDPQPLHIHVGSRLGQADVLVDSRVQQAFNVTDVTDPTMAATSLVPTSQDFSDFFIWRTQGTPEEAKAQPAERAIACQKPFVLANNTEVLHVRLATWPSSSLMTPIPLLTDAETAVDVVDGKAKGPAAGKRKPGELLFSLQYECLQSGTSLVTVVLRLFETTPGQRSTDSVVWSFMKDCRSSDAAGVPVSPLARAGEGNETNVEGNTAIPGLLIGSAPELASDIVEHGETKEGWAKAKDEAPTPAKGNATLAFASLHHYKPEQESTKFYVRYDPPVANQKLTVNKAVYIIDDPTVLMIEDSGDLADQSTTLVAGGAKSRAATAADDANGAAVSGIYTLALAFTCKAAGSSRVTVVLAFPDLGGDEQAGGRVTFAFVKECAGLAVADGTEGNGIDISLSDNDADASDKDAATASQVVVNGVVQPAWRPVQDVTEEGATKVRTKSADKSTKHVSFFVKLRAGSPAVEYDAPIVSAYSVAPEGSKETVDPNDIVVRPSISGSVLEASRLKAGGLPTFLVLDFNCIKSGEAVVTIKLPLRPSGAIQFNLRKICLLDTKEAKAAAEAVKEYTTGAELAPLPGINIGHFQDTSEVMLDGIPRPGYHLSEAIVDAEGNKVEQLVPFEKHLWVNFWLWKNTSVPDAIDLRFGRPELISTADIARPVISGLGAEGGLLADNEYSIVTVTFHCFTPGTTRMTLILPLVADEWLNAANEPVSIKPPRADPIKLTFMKTCPTEAMDGVTGQGGVGLSGFSIGLSPNTSELVFNGFPQPAYYGQHAKPKPDWDNAIVDEKVDTTTMYLHYESRATMQSQTVGKEVLFQAPVVVPHNPVARPTLGDVAAIGGILMRDGPPMELDLQWNCRYEGLAVATLLFPIIPHGQITVTIPKRCSGPSSPHGAKVAGLHVGLTPTGTEVVQDGQTRPRYIAYATKKHHEHKVYADEAETTFYIRAEKEPVRAIEPLVYAHKPIVNVRVTHALLANSSVVDDDIDGDEILIDDLGGAINITWACVEDGHTDVTVSLSLLPRGFVQWTFEKICAEIDQAVSPELDHPITEGGITTSDDSAKKPASSGSSSSSSDYEEVDLNSEYEKYRALKGPDDMYSDDDDSLFSGFPAPPAFQPPPYAANQGATNRDEFEAYLKQRQADLDAAKKKDPASGSINAGGDGSEYQWTPLIGENPFKAIDHTAESGRVQFTRPNLSHLQIGTGRTGETVHDVWYNSLPSSRYQMKKGALDATRHAIIKPDEESTIFYLSTSSKDDLDFGVPSVTLAKQYEVFLKPTLSGPAAAGGVLPGTKTSTEVTTKKLELTYHCTRGGTFAVGIRIPVGPVFAAFRVIKICPPTDIAEDTSVLTAGGMFNMIGVVCFVVALTAAIVVFRRMRARKQAATTASLANTRYAPVQTGGGAGEDDEDGMEEIGD